MMTTTLSTTGVDVCACMHVGSIPTQGAVYAHGVRALYEGSTAMTLIVAAWGSAWVRTPTATNTTPAPMVVGGADTRESMFGRGVPPEHRTAKPNRKTKARA